MEENLLYSEYSINTRKHYNMDSIYLVTYAGLIILSVIQTVSIVSNSGIALKILNYAQWILCTFDLLIIVTSKCTIKQFFIIGIALTFLFIGYYESGMSVLFRGALLIIASRDILYNRLYHVGMRTYAFMVSIIFILGFCNLIPSNYRRGYSSYGFVHPNMLGLYILVILCYIIILYYKKIKLWNYIIFLLIAFANLMLTDSKNSSIIMVIAVILLFILKTFGEKLLINKFFVLGLYLLMPILFVLSCYVAINFDINNEIYFQMNIQFSDRLSMAHTFINYYTPQLFGQEITRIMVENSYIVLLWQDGIIPSLLFLFIYLRLINKAIQYYDYGALVCLICFAIYGLAEVKSFDIYCNVALLTLLTTRTTNSNTVLQKPRKRRFKIKLNI